MKDNKLIAVFKGHKVRSDHKAIMRIYDNPLQPWSVTVYDEVYKTLTTVPKEELYDFIIVTVFKRRKLWTTGRELECLFSKLPLRNRHVLKEPSLIDTVCFIKREFVSDLENGDLDYSQISTLNSEVARLVNWQAPHCCLHVKDNVSDKTKSLIITIPEYSSIVLANPKYFDVKEKTR